MIALRTVSVTLALAMIALCAWRLTVAGFASLWIVYWVALMGVNVQSLYRIFRVYCRNRDAEAARVRIGAFRACEPDRLLVHVTDYDVMRAVGAWPDRSIYAFAVSDWLEAELDGS